MADSWMPKNKTELMSAIEHEWNLLMDLAERLKPEQMLKPDEGGWSPKDNLAHLAEWMKVLMGYHMDHHPRHEVLNMPEEKTKDWDMEVINPELFKRNKDRSTEDVLAELKRVYAQLKSKLESMSFEYLMKPRHADDPEKRPVLLWILGDTTEHFLEHRETIERGLKANQA